MPVVKQQPQIGNLVRELRQNLGLSQEKFAAKLGVTFPTINRWENSRATPSPLAIEKIEGVLRSLSDSSSAALRELGSELLSRYVLEEEQEL